MMAELLAEDTLNLPLLQLLVILHLMTILSQQILLEMLIKALAESIPILTYKVLVFSLGAALGPPLRTQVPLR